MQEAFLHFIWKLQYFNQQRLLTECGQAIEVLQQGIHNLHAGPDFSLAKIKIDDLIWVGNVELHVKTSDWNAHQHQKDVAYNNVILHVVWEDDKTDTHVKTRGGFSPPVLVLKSRIPLTVLKNYKSLLKSDQKIPCADTINVVPDLHKDFMLEKALAERIEAKADRVKEKLLVNKNDWEQTAYELFMQGMGFKYNGDSFRKLAAQLPIKIVRKQEKLIQVEALLFGQAGFLVDAQDEEAYFYKLKKEYSFLKKKFRLSKELDWQEWHFMRIRPSNFPTIRIAQIAAVLFHEKKLVSFFEEIALKKPKQIFKGLKQSLYWQSHYHFGKKSAKNIPFVGIASQELLMINIAVPLLVARADYIGNTDLFGEAMDILNHIKSEKNSILEKWNALGISSKTAYDSQALLGLYQAYCKPKKCLQCRVGGYLMKKESTVIS